MSFKVDPKSFDTYSLDSRWAGRFHFLWGYFYFLGLTVFIFGLSLTSFLGEIVFLFLGEVVFIFGLACLHFCGKFVFMSEEKSQKDKGFDR